MVRVIHILFFVALAVTGSMAAWKPKCPIMAGLLGLTTTKKPPVAVAPVAVTEKTKIPDLYYVPPSPPSRIALMTASVLGLDLNLKYVDLLKGEQMTKEYLKINPQHTVPALDDNGFTLGESRAIQAYLASKSPKGETIYPKDLKQRAKIEEMLYFDVGRLYPQFLAIYGIGTGNPSDENKKKFAESLGMLEEYITRNGWAAIDRMTIADLSLLATVTLTEAVGYDISSYSKITQWVFKTKAAVPNYQVVNQMGLVAWKKMWEAANTKEMDTKETDTKETDTKETDSKETDTEETDSKETDTKETGTKETDSKETDTKETESKETESKETDTKE